MKYDVVIIGAGPAGLSASIYALRANLSVLVIEKESFGGKLPKTYQVDNYPGLANIKGMELADNFVNQAKGLGAQIIVGEVEKIEDKVVYLSDGTNYDARAIIIATGTKEKALDLPDSEKYVGRGISYCAVCDGFFYRNKPVAIIGGGNSALEEALFLASIVEKITIIIRRDEFRADKSLVEKVLENPKIRIIYKHLPKSLAIEDDKIVGLNIKNVETGEISNVPCKGIFPYIGANPETNFISKDLLNENGYLLVNENMETKVPGIYGAGDCIEKDLRQIVTACNDGAIAANNAIKYLKNN